MSPAASKPQAKRKEGPKTTYVILSALGNMAVPLFKAVDDVEATSSTAAIREHMRRSGGTENWKSIEPVLFVAVPKRSWQVIKAQVERTERLIVGPWKPNGTAKQNAEPVPEGHFDNDGMEREAAPEEYVTDQKAEMARLRREAPKPQPPGPTAEMDALLTSTVGAVIPVTQRRDADPDEIPF